jgi:hypothetical protein
MESKADVVIALSSPRPCWVVEDGAVIAGQAVGVFRESDDDGGILWGVVVIDPSGGVFEAPGDDVFWSEDAARTQSRQSVAAS